MKKRIHVTLVGLAAMGALLLLGASAYTRQPKFGTAPEGKRLERIQRSPNYANGEFHNTIPTPMLKEGQGTMSILVSDAINQVDNLRPAHPLPHEKVDLKGLDPNRDTLVWLGHSSFFIQISGKRILVDPVLSPYAAPVSFAIRAFDGTTVYTVDDLPAVDVMLITHDHWDHLDHDTVVALERKVSQVFVPLGVGVYFEQWGYAQDKVREGDWYDKLAIDNNFAVHFTPARHYSGRALTRNKTLWAGFVLESGQRRILLGGDSGYGPHFKELGQRFGSFDLVALDMGQYDPRWPYIHMTPQEASQATQDLNAKALLPAHVGRFSLARHAWDEPFERILAESQGKPYRLATPRIGEALHLDRTEQRFSTWWRVVQPISSAPTLLKQ